MKRLKKLLVFLLLFTTNVVSASYLDDWPDDALCGWMQQSSPPEYIAEEVKKEVSFVLMALHQLIPMHHQIKVLVIQE